MLSVFKKSFTPETAPQWAMVVLTFLVVCFAFLAWTESKRTTEVFEHQWGTSRDQLRALEGQRDAAISQLKIAQSAQRPFVFLFDGAIPGIRMGPIWPSEAVGQDGKARIGWNWAYTNYGLGLAHEVSFMQLMRVGKENAFVATVGDPTWVSLGPPLAPAKALVNYATVQSRRTYTQQEYEDLRKQDDEISLLVKFRYRDVYGVKYDEAVCLGLLHTNALRYIETTNCKVP